MAVRISRSRQQYNEGLRDELRKINVKVVIYTSGEKRAPARVTSKTSELGM